MSEPLDPMGPELRKLVDRERGRPDPSEAARGLVRAKLKASLPQLAWQAAPRPGPREAPSPLRGHGPALLKPLTRYLLVSAVSYGAGVGSGMALDALRRPPAAPTASVAPVPAPAPVPVAAPPAPAAIPPPVTPAPVPHRIRPASRPPAAPSRPSPRPPPTKAADQADADLEAEDALVERARAALSRRQPDDALAALAEHRRRFPNGRLVEERSALEVEALASSGRRDDARSKAQEFQNRYPDSLLWPAVQEALDRMR
ncbi:MAG: tetratricopeptide repeat protein [Myxococcales bacterium]